MGAGNIYAKDKRWQHDIMAKPRWREFNGNKTCINLKAREMKCSES